MSESKPSITSTCGLTQQEGENRAISERVVVAEKTLLGEKTLLNQAVTALSSFTALLAGDRKSFGSKFLTVEIKDLVITSMQNQSMIQVSLQTNIHENLNTNSTS